MTRFSIKASSKPSSWSSNSIYMLLTANLRTLSLRNFFWSTAWLSLYVVQAPFHLLYKLPMCRDLHRRKSDFPPCIGRFPSSLLQLDCKCCSLVWKKQVGKDRLTHAENTHFVTRFEYRCTITCQHVDKSPYIHRMIPYYMLKRALLSDHSAFSNKVVLFDECAAISWSEALECVHSTMQ